MDTVIGVYCIDNIVDNKKYIGQSIDVYRRWQDHKRELNGNRHHNIYLQRAWNKYGECNFIFYILEECSINLLDKREIYYINSFCSTQGEYGYNIDGGGNVNKTLSDETKLKISKSRLGKYRGGENPAAHPVYCPQLDKLFMCIMDAERDGIACESSIRDCLKGKSKTAGRHPKTGERLTWYNASDLNDPELSKIINDEKNGISHVTFNARCVSLYCPELDRLFIGGAPQIEREGIANAGSVRSYLSGLHKSAGKHPLTKEPLHWIRTDSEEYNNILKQNKINNKN